MMDEQYRQLPARLATLKAHDVKKSFGGSIDSLVATRMKHSRRFYDAIDARQSINFMASEQFAPCACHRRPTSYASLS
jgi:hypothetical protein